MPHPKKWIEAQLKRGYTKEQIKNFLIRKGYPLNAVAEVDKISVRGTSKKETSDSKKSHSSTIFILVVIVVIVIGVVYFMGGDKGVEEKSTTEVLPAVSQIEFKSIQELCKEYPEVLNETTCSRAGKIAINRYPGNISSIRRATLSENEVTWVVELYLDSQITVKGITIEEKANVIIDASTSKIISTRPVS